MKPLSAHIRIVVLEALIVVSVCVSHSAVWAVGTWSATGSMGTARAYHDHAETLLPDGRVLVTGGFGAGLSAELYDPTTGTFSATGSMGTARWGHTATLLPNGKVLLVRGTFPGGYTATAELYDPAIGTFSPTGSTGQAGYFHTATLLPNGRVLVTGGGNDSPSAFSTAQLYDLTTGTFSATGPMGTPRAQHSATLLSNGEVLVIGGTSSQPNTPSSPGNSQASAQLYDPATGTFGPTGAMATPRLYHTATLLPSGRVLVVGGNNASGPLTSAEVYDPATGTFSPTGSLSTARYAHTATLLPSGMVLVTGGIPGTYTASAELYDPTTGTFSVTGSMGTARGLHTATLLPNWKVLVTGGFTNGGMTLTSAELYDPVFSRLINISTRARVQTADNVMIGGFWIGGTGPKTVLIRARGGSLGGAPFNNPGVLANPTMQLYSGSTVIAQNNDWQSTDPLCLSPATGCGGAPEITATGLDPCQPNPGQTVAPPGCTQESAILTTLAPGGYTAIVSGVGGTSGMGLVEVFEVDTSLSALINISTRARVETGDNVMIGGFYIGGNAPKTVLIRARGGSLGGAPFNNPGVLANPTMQLFSGSTVIAQNNDWQSTDPLCLGPATACGGEPEITATGLDPCQPNPGQTVAPPGCSQESAVYVTLPPGGYTAIVRGVGATSGMGLVEVFEVP